MLLSVIRFGIKSKLWWKISRDINLANSPEVIVQMYMTLSHNIATCYWEKPRYEIIVCSIFMSNTSDLFWKFYEPWLITFRGYEKQLEHAGQTCKTTKLMKGTLRQHATLPQIGKHSGWLEGVCVANEVATRAMQSYKWVSTAPLTWEPETPFQPFQKQDSYYKNIPTWRTCYIFDGQILFRTPVNLRKDDVI